MSEQETKRKKGFTRRKFLVGSAVGVGVILGTGYLSRGLIRRYLAGVVNTVESPYIGNTKDPSLWFEVTAENNIILHSPKVEMGQGAFTGMAQLAAEELEIAFEAIQVKHAESASGNVDGFGTGGSTTISSLWIPLRELAATLREMLKQEAVKILNIPAENLTIENGIISFEEQSITYGEIVEQVKKWSIPKTPELKTPDAFRFIGREIPRVDLYDKVVGSPIFGMDAVMEDMYYGAIVKPSKIGVTFQNADISKASQMPGVVKIVKEKDFVGVIAKTYMEAENAKNAILVEWNGEKKWQHQEIREMILVGKGTPTEIQKKGNAEKILEDPGVIKVEFESPIGAHAQIEPNASVALVEDDHATVIISTQVVNNTRKAVAKRLGISKNNVNIIPTYLGGGFGGKLDSPIAVQSAVLSQAVGKPVKCFFNRQEEFQNDTFRPPTHNVLKAKLANDGMIQAIEHHISSGDVMFGSPLLPAIAGTILGADVGAWRGGMIQYSGIPNYRAVSWRVKLPFATSWWRSLGLLANTFAIESFMDELAIESGIDPVEFRLKQIADDEAGRRLKSVIEKAADRAGWQNGVLNGRAMGFAASTDVNTPVAQIAEVSVNDKEIKVHKVTCVIDPGLAVNPDQVKAQCEGCIIMGMSAALYEKMDVKDGELQPIIYGPYQMALMKDAPKDIDVVILENTGTPGAVGEPPLGPIGAAIANAVYRITGQRLRKMPLKLT